MADIPGAAPAAAPPASSPAPASSTISTGPASQSVESSSPPVSSSSSPPSGEPPRERWDSILRNAREKTRAEVAAEYEGRYGKYDAFERDPWSAVQSWLGEASQHSLYGPMVQQWVQQQASQRRGNAPSEEPKADVPIVDGNGQVTGYTFSDKQLRQWHQWNESNLQAKWDERLAPLERHRAQSEQQQQHQEMVQQATQHATTTLQELRQQPYFKAHEPAIRQALLDHEEWGDNVHAAYNHVLVTQILPNLSQAEQKQVIDSLQAKGSATTVAPGGTASGRPQFKSFRAAAEYYAAHPEEAERMAHR